MDLVNELEDAVAAQLEERGLAVSRPLDGPDLLVSVPTAEGTKTLLVETKASSGARRPKEFEEQATAADAQVGPTAIFAQRYISTRRGQTLRAEEIPYVDTVGNMWLRLPGLYILVEGRAAPPPPPRSATGDRLSRPSSLRVTFALLTQPLLLQASLRELAEQCGTSIGAAQAATADLTKNGFLLGRGGTRRLAKTNVLAERWVFDFGTRLLPKLGQRTLRGPSPQWWFTTNRPSPEEGLLGGEAACELLGYPLRAAETLLYATPPWGPLRKAGRLAEKGDAVVSLRERFWPIEPDRDTAPSLLIYADLLLKEEPRLQEMANQMRESDDELRRLWAR